MLGKFRYRTGRFSMCHALVLMVFIGLAQVIGPASPLRNAEATNVEQGDVTGQQADEARIIHVQANDAAGDDTAQPLRAVLWHAVGGDVLITLPARLRHGMTCDDTI